MSIVQLNFNVLLYLNHDLTEGYTTDQNTNKIFKN